MQEADATPSDRWVLLLLMYVCKLNGSPAVSSLRSGFSCGLGSRVVRTHPLSGSAALHARNGLCAHLFPACTAVTVTRHPFSIWDSLATTTRIAADIPRFPESCLWALARCAVRVYMCACVCASLVRTACRMMGRSHSVDEP